MTKRDEPTQPVTSDGEDAPLDTAGGGNRYRVLRRIGKGGMGEVMAVRDEAIGREIALKRIRRNAPNQRTIARFLREAAIQGRLEHPAIVPIHEIGHDANGMPYFTMKKVAGTTLARVLVEHDPGTSRQHLLRAFVDVCLAIEFAHRNGVVHRDLKPDNIVLGEFGEVYVIDWGVAKVLGDHASDVDTVSDETPEADDETATIPGTRIGTPGYMSPEQERAQHDIDGRADVYALGCVLYEILTSERLATAPKKDGVRDARPSHRFGDAPPELDDLCVEATLTDRDQRIRTARELADRVQRYLDGDRDLELRRSLAREHLAAAQAAFAADDRTRAMREAASSLALDPSHTGAAELVGRLMLEPPSTTPREVEAMVEADEVLTGKRTSHVGAYVYLAILAFTPLMWWAAPGLSPYVVLTAALAATSAGVAWWMARAGVRGREWYLAASTLLLIGVVSRAYTPFLCAPVLGAVSAMASQFGPTQSRIARPSVVAIATSLAVLGPWIAERLGLMSQTTTIGPEGVKLEAPAIGSDPLPALLAGALYVVCVIVGVTLLAHDVRRRERATRVHLFTQAWQLRQLIAR
jgi:serine/threonine-protein kinase